MFDKVTEINLLFDFYGKLLSKRQQQVMELYHEENYSLSEIAEEFSISRQGVHDALKNGEKSLYDYESKLGLVERFAETRKKIDDIDRYIDELIARSGADAVMAENLKKVKSIIDKMEDSI